MIKLLKTIIFTPVLASCLNCYQYELFALCYQFKAYEATETKLPNSFFA